MAVSDPVADFLTRIRNAVKAQHRYVDVNWSKLKENLAEILQETGFIHSYLVKKDEKGRGTLRLFLKYKTARRAAIRGLKRISKPGVRKYIKHDEIPFFYGGLGLSILSTSQGVMSGSAAQKKRVGGELLCYVW